MKKILQVVDRKPLSKPNPDEIISDDEFADREEGQDDE